MKKETILTMLSCFVLLIVIPMKVSASGEVNIKPFVKIYDFEMNQKTAKKGDVISYSFILEDIGTKTFVDKEFEETFDGIASINLFWQSTGKQYIEQYVEWKPEVGKNYMRISGEIPIRKGMQPGIWSLQRICIDEISYGLTSERAKDLLRELNLEDEGLGPGFPLNVYDLRFKQNLDKRRAEFADYYDLSELDFEVKGTKADNKAPKISLKSLKLSKKVLSKNQKATFSVKVTDDSKITDVIADFDLIYYPMKYNKKTKCYECKVKAPIVKKTENELAAIHVRDIHGNYKTYYPIDSKATKKAFKKIKVKRK